MKGIKGDHLQKCFTKLDTLRKKTLKYATDCHYRSLSIIRLTGMYINNVLPVHD